MSERWLPVVGWEGIYSVSDHGRIRSESRVVVRGDGVRQLRSERILKPYRSSAGRLHVDLADHPRRQRGARVQQLVLAAFVGPRPDGMDTLHWDDDPANNRLSNLRYGTRRDNALDKVRNGHCHQSNKTHCPQGHEYSGENLLKRPVGRGCRACVRVQKRAYWDRQKAANALRRSAA